MGGGRTGNQVMTFDLPSIHGIGDLAWDHATIPSRIWRSLRQVPSGCWHAPDKSAKRYRDVFVERMIGLEPHETYTVVPTCGSRLCTNPAHICVTPKTALSTREGS